MQACNSNNPFQDVMLEDLLGRQQVPLGLEGIRETIQDRVVMVTGAAGSIGSELCRQTARFGPRAVVGFDQSERGLFQLGAALDEGFPSLAFHSEIGNITRCDDVNHAMQQYQPSVVLHAAACKHVPMLERYPFAAVENNIFGTLRVAQAAAAHDVEHFVLISTDKAVRPASMMGVTKRVAELTVGTMQQEQGTKFDTVRFGNVLESSGSVVPIFKNQIAAGGPVTVTHPEMRRYFMTASEAAQLVLQVVVLGKGGETFVLDMGAPVKIVDLAGRLILLCGQQGDQDIRIEFSGMRPGEKLSEELHSRSEQLVPTSHAGISNLFSSEHVDRMQISAFLQQLQQAVLESDVLHMISLLQEIVPDYVPGPYLLENASSIQANQGIAVGD